MPSSNSSRVAYAFLCFTALFWGGNAIAGKLAVGHISPMTLTAVRWIIAFLILASFSLPQLRRDWRNIRRYLPLLLAYGMTGFALFNIALYTALNHTSAINVTIEQSGMPMLVFLANFLLFGMRVTLAQIVGFLMSILGVALTAANGDLGRLAALDINRGDAIMLLAVVLYGGYSVALRWKPALHWKSLMTVMSFSAMVTALPFAVWEQASGSGKLPDLTGLAVALYTAVFPAILAQIFYMRGVEMIGSNRGSLFINLVPVFGTLLAIAILGEAFYPYHALALILVIGGIWLAERGAGRPKKSGG
ncbi:DMT family transporter [Oricola cellulosilytica]|uniref:DMT family transporter n=1 Tax=Oricola cellulosilytica TaxID=1429082 RepID=A0A4R0PDQ1_9HYPH|nr:DMT family transporter [Oricola cellulosilytica]TCD15426.1 DMT family transporter [Oricola cellulosilytica]